MVAVDGRRRRARARRRRVGDAAIRRRVFASLGVVVLVAAIIPAPWYGYQATRYANPVFNRTQPEAFLLARRPLGFYVDARVPEIVRSPWSGSFNDRFWPVLYAETWGDYFGIWSWGPGRGERTDAIDATLARQSALGVLPTALALAGMVALLGLALTRPREDVGRLIAALPPLLQSRRFSSSQWPIRRPTATQSRGHTPSRRPRLWRCASASRSRCYRDAASSASFLGSVSWRRESPSFRSSFGELARDSERASG